MGLAVYSYEVARVFVPLLVLCAAVVYRRELTLRWRETAVAGAVLAAAVAPVAWLLVSRTGAAQARFDAISIFGAGGGPVVAAQLFLSNYLAQLSPWFLVVTGDSELRHSPGIGPLNAVEFAAVCIGLFAMARRRRGGLWFAWIALFPVAASLTRVGIPHALRCIVALPGLQDVAGIGMAWGLSRLPRAGRRIARQIAALAVIAGFAPFMWLYFVAYSARSGLDWQYGVKQAVEFLKPGMDGMGQVVFHRVTGGRIPRRLLRAHRSA